MEIAPEARLIEAYRRIIVRDKSRYKPVAIRELALIMLLSDPTGYLHQLPESQRISTGKRDLRFEDDWYADDVFMYALEHYKNTEINSPSLRLLQEAKEGLHLCTDTIGFFRAALTSLMEELKATQENENRVSIEALQEAVKGVKELFSLTQELPNMLKKVKELEKAVQAELQQDNAVYGGGTISKYEAG